MHKSSGARAPSGRHEGAMLHAAHQCERVGMSRLKTPWCMKT